MIFRSHSNTRGPLYTVASGPKLVVISYFCILKKYLIKKNCIGESIRNIVCEVDKLINMIKKNNDVFLSEEWLEALSSQYDIAIKALIKSLSDDSPDFRKEAIYVLADMVEGELVVDIMIDLCNNSDYMDSWGDYIIALGKIGDKRAVDFLINCIQDDFASSLDTLAVEALGKIGDVRAVDTLISYGLNYHSELGFRGSHMEYSAVKALGEIGSFAAVEPLIEVLDTPDLELCHMAVQALGLIGDEKAIEPLIYALNDSDRNPKYQLDRRLVNLAIENIEQ